ncbi:hypothetical protein NEOLEDRAFT_1176625 [Neolentinus lepideus HHB14362 ss-1]|uniref:Uncharacterized protein n=1 Tax=Neolentinus lepideus HHB14362 ss-1 TaxID=1314782 RepID=A0A165U460_9AGAM|nr:hypothetical protein NEOLEDRAFT_1176625 [Neolentinus lepideus HHB14362 ss-1]
MYHAFSIPSYDNQPILSTYGSPLDPLVEPSNHSEPVDYDQLHAGTARNPSTTQHQTARTISFQSYDGPEQFCFQHISFSTPSAVLPPLESPASVSSVRSWPTTPSPQTPQSTGGNFQFQVHLKYQIVPSFSYNSPQDSAVSNFGWSNTATSSSSQLGSPLALRNERSRTQTEGHQETVNYLSERISERVSNRVPYHTRSMQSVPLSSTLSALYYNFGPLDDVDMDIFISGTLRSYGDATAAEDMHTVSSQQHEQPEALNVQFIYENNLGHIGPAPLIDCGTGPSETDSRRRSKYRKIGTDERLLDVLNHIKAAGFKSLGDFLGTLFDPDADYKSNQSLNLAVSSFLSVSGGPGRRPADLVEYFHKHAKGEKNMDKAAADMHSVI